jgi:hypothetical protein
MIIRSLEESWPGREENHPTLSQGSRRDEKVFCSQPEPLGHENDEKDTPVVFGAWSYPSSRFSGAQPTQSYRGNQPNFGLLDFTTLENSGASSYWVYQDFQVYQG